MDFLPPEIGRWGLGAAPAPTPSQSSFPRSPGSPTGAGQAARQGLGPSAEGACGDLPFPASKPPGACCGGGSKRWAVLGTTLL